MEVRVKGVAAGAAVSFIILNWLLIIVMGLSFLEKIVPDSSHFI